MSFDRRRVYDVLVCEKIEDRVEKKELHSRTNLQAVRAKKKKEFEKSGEILIKDVFGENVLQLVLDSGSTWLIVKV